MKVKKHSGFVEQILSTAVCLLLLFTVLASIVNFCALLDVKRGIASAVRGSMLLYESGETKQNVTNDLKAKLNAKGFSNSEITITLTPSSEPSYMDEISITVTINTTAQNLKLAKVQSLFRRNYEFKTKQTSISKKE